MDNVIDFTMVLKGLEKPTRRTVRDTQKALEVEHELLEAQMQVWSLHRDLERMRRAHEKTKRKLMEVRRKVRVDPVCQSII